MSQIFLGCLCLFLKKGSFSETCHSKLAVLIWIFIHYMSQIRRFPLLFKSFSNLRGMYTLLNEVHLFKKRFCSIQKKGLL